MIDNFEIGDEVLCIKEFIDKSMFIQFSKNKKYKIMDMDMDHVYIKTDADVIVPFSIREIIIYLIKHKKFSDYFITKKEILNKKIKKIKKIKY